MRSIKHVAVYTALMATAVALAVTAAGPAWASPVSASPAPANSGGTWGTALRPSTPTTNPRFTLGGIASVACAPSGYCAAVGSYDHGSQARIAYVLTESKGKWSKIKVFDTSLLANFPEDMAANLVSCPSAGNCSAIGEYNSINMEAPFTVNERSGTWAKARPIVGTDGVDYQISSFACTSAGNCVAGGNFVNMENGEFGGESQPFVVSERHGVWGHAEDLPGTSTLSISYGDVNSISCTGTTCLGTGLYEVGLQDPLVDHKFVAVAKNGVWGTAKPAPGLPSDAGVGQVACSPGGTCTLLAFAATPPQVFTVSEKNGTWDTRPNDLPGQFNVVDFACPSAGNCSALGAGSSGLPFVATEHNGTWKAERLPGLLSLDHGKSLPAGFGSLSCGAPGNCAATGSANVYAAANVVTTQAFVVNEVGGRWHWAEVVPGIVKLDKDGSAQGVAIACSSAGHCAAGGYLDVRGSKSPYPFVVTER